MALRDKDTESSSFEDLEGAFIIADDGQFLGKITTNFLDSKSITNSLGQYGSTLTATSIFNQLGNYGSELSRFLRFNSLTSTPPRIFKNDKFVGYLTANELKTPRVDPHALIGWLKSQE